MPINRHDMQSMAICTKLRYYDDSYTRSLLGLLSSLNMKPRKVADC